jgi:hypothetical protein
MVAVTQITIVASEPLSDEDTENLRLPLKETIAYFMLNDTETRSFIVN